MMAEEGAAAAGSDQLTLNFALPHQPIYEGKDIDLVIMPGKLLLGSTHAHLWVPHGSPLTPLSPARDHFTHRRCWRVRHHRGPHPEHH